jgi:hypothetical protein
MNADENASVELPFGMPQRRYECHEVLLRDAFMNFIPSGLAVLRF